MRNFTLAQKVSHNKKIHQDDVECTVDGRVVVYKRDERRNFRCVCGRVLTGGATSVSRHAKKCETLRYVLRREEGSKEGRVGREGGRDRRTGRRKEN